MFFPNRIFVIIGSDIHIVMVYKKIILCGLRATGKTTLFWDLQDKLSWPTFSVSLYIRDYIHRHHLKNTDDIDKLGVDISRDIDRRVKNLLGSDNYCIIDARAYAGIFSPIPETLKLLLKTRDEVRLKRAALREGTTPEAQKTRLLKKENRWKEKMNQIYGRDDFLAPQFYDLVIDTTLLTPEEVLARVIEEIKPHASGENVIYTS